MTGRGRGYCAGYPAPGYAFPGGRRMGWGRGWGRGRFAPSAYPYRVSPSQEKEMLEREKDVLKQELQAMKEEMKKVEERIKELKGK